MDFDTFVQNYDPEAEDLRGEPRRQAEAAAMEKKCGTCYYYSVRPNEVDLARMARAAGYCGPGSYCFGGPVRGVCLKYGRQMMSTQVCDAYKEGGPNSGVGQYQMGSASKAHIMPPSTTFDPPSTLTSLLVVGTVAATLGVAALVDRLRSR